MSIYKEHDMKVVQGKWLSGETPYGVRKGIVGLGSRTQQGRPSNDEMRGSEKALQPASASDEIEKFWLRKHQELLAQENASTAQPAPAPPKR
jgi:hypothetical protein